MFKNIKTSTFECNFLSMYINFVFFCKRFRSQTVSRILFGEGIHIYLYTLLFLFMKGFER